MREQILSYALKYQGEWHKITEALAKQESWSHHDYQGNYITLVDDEYPAVLKRLTYAPWILFYEGDLTLLQKTGVAIVGSRQYNAYGEAMCRHICGIIKHKAVIVSGLAKGIDAIAHQEAMDLDTIAVIGCGLDIAYPKENAYLYEQMRRHQLIISEYPYGVKPLAHHFPWRNRLIAALSQAVIVIQAKKRSGTLLTVNEALELDIPVYCVPHPMKEKLGEGCNLLIAQGANILTDDQDIYAIL